MSYAQGTSVPIDRSKAEIERVLARYGAERFAYFTSAEEAAIAFQVDGRAVRMRLLMPEPDCFVETNTGKKRKPAAVPREVDQEVRRRWRALALVVKAKLEAIDSGIATFEDEWLAYLVTSSGKTVGEQLAPQLAEAKPGALLLSWERPS